MTLAEILKQNGVAEDTIRAIQNDMKTAKLFTTGEEIGRASCRERVFPLV